jgi:hypothetical protein
MPYRVGPPAAAAAGGAVNETWTRSNIADGSWTFSDPDGTLSGISNTGGLNSVTIDVTNNDKVYDGGIHFKEITHPDGTSFDLLTESISIEMYIHWPNQGWAVLSPTASGGLSRPGGGSRCYTVAGVTTDPENFPSTPGQTEWPRSIIGLGIRAKNSTYKNHIMQIRNYQTGLPRGSIEITNADLNSLTADNYNIDGYKFMNRLSWRTTIRPFENLPGSGALWPADQPLIDEIAVERLWDNGDRKTGTEERIVGMRMAKVRSDKLYLFISNGRANAGGAPGGPVTVDFDVYYRIVGTPAHPSGTTGL